MPIHKDDRILWFLVGIGLFFAYKGISEQLHQVRKLTEVTRDESQGKKLDQNAENAVSLDTLEKLTKSSNNELRVASIRIICERFLNTRDGTARETLYADLAGRNPVKRDRALKSATFLLRSNASHNKEFIECFYSYSFLRPLTQCLINLLEEHKRPIKPKPGPAWRPSAIARNSPIRPPNRPASETQALKILGQVLGPAFHTAMVAGIVSEWLAKYPFPCALPENGSRRDLVLTLYHSWCNDDPVMSNVLAILLAHKAGREALNKAGYMVRIGDDDEEYAEDDNSYGDYDGDIIMQGGEDTAGGLIASDSVSRRRPRRRQTNVDSEEEQAIRRRRREAMVLSDGGGPLGQENIIQRDDGTNRHGHDTTNATTTDNDDDDEAVPRPGLDANVEEQLARLRELDAEFENAPILDDHELFRNLQ